MTTRWGILGRALAVTLTAGVTLGVAGCGNEGHSGSASSSAVKTSSSSVLSKSEIIPESYRAAVEAGSAHLTMTTTGQAAMKAQGDVSYAGGSSRMQMTLTMPQMGAGKRMEMRYVGKVLYLQIPFVTQPGKFVALDPSDRRSLLAKSFAGWGARLDPLSIMKAMQGAVKSADRVGGGSIGGTAVDHYKVVMDPAKVLEAKDRQVPVDVPATFTFDLWLDQQHLLRKMAFDFSGTAFEVLLTKWGEPVTVQRPAAADVVKAPGF